jgi:hypothetical protein
MSTPHQSHLDIDLLADLQEGLLEPEQVTTAAEHLNGCAECRAQSLALDDVRAALRAEGAHPDVTAPEDVVRRLDDALAAATTVTAASATVATASATVTPLTALTTQVRQPWKTRVLQAAAVFVLIATVAALGYGGIRGLRGGASGAGTSASGPSNASREKSAAARRFAVMNSDRDYTASSLKTAVPGLLSEAAQDSAATGAEAPAPVSPAVPQTSPTPAAGSLADPKRLRNGTALAQCVANLAPAIDGLPKGPVTPLAVDIARFEGKPATIILLPDPDPSFVNAFAVEPGCPTGTFLAYQHVALP